MYEENTIASLSHRLQKQETILENIQTNGAFIFIKKKKENNSENRNRSIDFYEKASNLLTKLEKLKEKNNINKNLIKISGKNSEKSLLKKHFNQLFENNVNKRIFSKKKLLEQIILNKKPDIAKDKSRTNSLNTKAIKLSKIFSKSNLLISDASTNDYNDVNKANFFKVKNDFAEGGKTGNYKSNKTFIQEKLEHINMNKTALFKKIKFESLKKFCKNVKLSDKKLGINLFINKSKSNINYEVRKNNCEEIKINSIKEKVRNYFIGRFNNIKEYFENWDENNQGRITVNDIYNYLNNKIKFKITKNEIKKLLFSLSNRNYLDLENFRILFFETSSKEKLFIRGNKIFESHQTLSKNMSDASNINRSENHSNISFFEKFRYNEIISLLLQEKIGILSQINKDRVELTFLEFYSILKNSIKEKKFNFDKEIKRLFNDYKDQNTDLINIYNFFEKINEKKGVDKKTRPIINIKKHANQGERPFYNKNKSSFIILNSRNTKSNNFSYKDSNQCQTNFISDKVTKKEIENDQKNRIENFNNLKKLKNININFKREKDREKRNILNSKLLIRNINSNKSYNAFITNNNENNIENENEFENSKLIEVQLPNIIIHERNKNKNSDIIDFL